MTDHNVALHILKHVYACEQDAPEKIAIIVHNYEQIFGRCSVSFTLLHHNSFAEYTDFILCLCLLEFKCLQTFIKTKILL